MDLPGATYFTALAALSVSFVGFTSIAIAFLNVSRGKLSAQHFTLVHIFVIHGLSAAAFALLPILMRLLDLPDDVI